MSSITVKHSKYPDKSKWQQLLIGFHKLGIETYCSEELDKYYRNNFGGYRGLIRIEVCVDDKSFFGWIDVAAMKRAYIQVLKPNEALFKIQYHQEHVENPDIIPLAQSTFIPKLYYPNLKMLRKLKKSCNYLYDVIVVFKEHSKINRRKCVEIISEQENWKSLAELYPYKCRKPIPLDLGKNKYGYVEHLKLQAQSKICVSIGGVGYNCFRDSEIMGMGACLLRLESDFVPIGNFKSHPWITVKPDFSDMVEKINYYLTHDGERERLASLGKLYFNTYLKPSIMAKNIIDTAKSRLGVE